MNNSVIVIYGPTGNGKSELAINLAKRINSYIISADSRKVYKDMNIGTNKEPFQNAIKEKIQIYGIDLISPLQRYSVHEFLDYTSIILNKNNDKIPIIVGGTVLYITALLKNYDLKNINPNNAIRIKYENMDLLDLQKILQSKYQDIWNNLNNSERNNKRRLIRWIEYSNKSNKVIHDRYGLKNFKFYPIKIVPDLETIKSRITKRVNKMIENGFIDEVKLLLEKYPQDSIGLSTMGYKEIINYLNGVYDLETAKSEIIRIHYKYARYQIRWINKFL